MTITLAFSFSAERADARAGYSNGVATSLELAGSAVNNAFLDSGTNALISHRLNSTVDGRYIFEARNGTISGSVPDSASVAMWGLGVLGMAFARRRRTRRNSTIAS